MSPCTTATFDISDTFIPLLKVFRLHMLVVLATEHKLQACRQSP
jgi:hypothetical protein